MKLLNVTTLRTGRIGNRCSLMNLILFLKRVGVRMNGIVYGYSTIVRISAIGIEKTIAYL